MHRGAVFAAGRGFFARCFNGKLLTLDVCRYRLPPEQLRHVPPDTKKSEPYV